MSSRRGTWFGLALFLLGCSATSRKASQPAPPAASVSPANASCTRADIVLAKADAAARSGNLLRARRLGEQAVAACPRHVGGLEATRVALAAATGEPTVLLQTGATARATGDLERARRAESAAVAELERRHAASLALVQRWSADRSTLLPNSPFAVTSLDGELRILDTRNGELKGIFAEPLEREGGKREIGKGFEVALDPQAERLLLRTIDLSVAREPAPACMSRLDFFDVRTNSLLKSECVMSWAFSGDGTKLALSRIVGWGDGAIMTAVVLDAKTLAPAFDILDKGNIRTLAFGPDGFTLAVSWSNRVSLTDVRTGKTDVWSAPSSEWLGNVTFGGSSAAFRTQSSVSVWNISERQLENLSFGRPCARLGSVMLSPSGRRVAATCDAEIVVWDVAVEKARGAAQGPSRWKAPKGSTPYDLRWFADERGLAAELHRDGSSVSVVLDTKLGRWQTLAAENEAVESIDPNSRLAVVVDKQASYRGRLLHLDAAFSPKEVPLPKCSAQHVAPLSAEKASVTCLGDDGPYAFVIDAKTLAMRAFPTSGSVPALRGNTLVSSDMDWFELRDVTTGELLPNSPIAPSPTEFEGLWDGDTFVLSVSFRNQKMRRYVRFGEKLTSETAPALPDSACYEHRGKVAWSATAPFVICDRRTGRALGEIPATAIHPDSRWERPALSDDGTFVLWGHDPPLLARVKDGQKVPLVGGPIFPNFVGSDLLVARTRDSDWGFWSARTGRRLTSSNEPPGTELIAANAGAGVSVEAGNYDLVLRDFKTGKQLERVAANKKGDLELDARGLLSVVEPSRIAFWQVPHARRRGVLLSHPKSGAVAFLTPARGFETSDDPLAWRDVLRCQVGLSELPLEVCIDAFLEPGIGAEQLLRDAAP